MSFLLGNRVTFQPDDIASLAHWYDATKLTGFSDGNSVGTWDDEAGTDDLAQGTGANQPTYQTNVIGGNPVVRFDGSDDYMEVDFATESQPNTVFAVVQLASEGGNPHVYDTFDTTRHVLSRDADADNWEIFAGSTVNGGTPDTNPTIITALYNGASSTLRQDGSQVASGNAGTNGLNGITVGSQRAGGTNPLDGDIGELLFYDADLSNSDRNSVESYLSDKWGITI